MSTRKPKDEFAVMKTFIEAVPNIDVDSLAALLVWLASRGKDEMDKRRKGATPEVPQ